MNPVNFSERANAAIVDEYYQRWLAEPESVDASWRAFFQGFTLGADGRTLAGGTAAAPGECIPKQSQVDSLIYHYRAIGHVDAHLNPLAEKPAPSKRLALEAFGLSEADLETEFEVGHYLGGGRMKLRDIVASLRETYCGSVGVEYVHIQDTEIRRWLQDRMEPARMKPKFTKAQKLRILRRLHKAELFEKFLHTKYVGQKRFSLEGGETIIAALDAIIDACPDHGVKEIVMGMAHRGRLNVLCSTLRKSFDELFEKFSENYIPDTVAGDGDVKYHLGYEAVLKTTGGQTVEVRLAPNPSHLEIVNPVVEGKARARQRIRNDLEKRTSVMPLLVHGDAALAGQGIVAETLNFSQLPGYRTGGTLHFVINNQIGFTTDPHDSRSTRYCTDVAKMIEAPIFHVNGDDPEAVCFVAQLALEFRVQFGRDVFVDMYCYRKHGHNETDEPSFTQPRLYKLIAAHPLISAIYTEQLTREGSVTVAEGDRIKAEYTAALEENLEKAKAREATRAAKRKEDPNAVFKGSTAEFQPGYSFAQVETKVGAKLIDQVFTGLTTVPGTFKVHPKIKRFIDTRAEAHKQGGPFDWGMGEALAFGTLMLEGTPIRLSGQDCERGTFSHRHSVWSDVETGAKYSPFKHLDPKQARFCVYNSLLSENAVLGFDYGYSLDYPDMLCIWEAQFGDFANGAQVVIDQFLSSGESKWQRNSGIVLLLPHGYEGQGPEHSSARLERFLQLCAEDNIQVANCTTPAQLFHLLRRQVRRDFRKPLVIMSPKSLLRHPAATSRLDDFTKGHFEEIIDDVAGSASDPVNRVILSSGKVYYDLVDYREKNKLAHTALVRVEQLYPLHAKRLAELAKKYAKAKLVWCQEEPENAGAGRWIMPQLEEIFGRKPVYAGRPPAASPAVGLLAKHRAQLASFLKDAFTL
ncbi:MAG: 2-oxoglutarate dehydrogenase E1 component [Candidatus Didemnitutus sp.]|nr:2-oxoglutarate dehydrogenase E1 component [Candidatus Didemnitutus sp.]